MKFGLKHYGSPTPKIVLLWSKIIKRICAVSAGSSVLTDHPYVGLSFLVIGGITDELVDYFGHDTPAPIS